MILDVVLLKTYMWTKSTRTLWKGTRQGVVSSCLESRVRVQRGNGSSAGLFFVGLKSMQYTLSKGKILRLSFRNIAQFSELGQILQSQEKYYLFQKSLLLEA